jgi:2-dehydro-3-deoxyphosphogluconate aldolase/(4S)-4-hydroxy-2-oxoglutarate aldolase
MSVMEQIGAQRVVPVIRCADAEDAVPTARAAAAAGMQVVELTLTTPGAHDALRELRGDGLTLGLGTLLRDDDVAPAVEAGAQFVVTFGCVPGLVAAAHEASIEAVEGALTPSEVLAAHRAGAAAVKIFPARAVSPAYLRDLRTVLPDVRLLPTGGIEPGRHTAVARRRRVGRRARRLARYRRERRRGRGRASLSRRARRRCQRVTARMRFT